MDTKDKEIITAEHLFCNSCGKKDACDHNASARCPDSFDDFFTGYKLGEQHVKEKAGMAFCDEMTRESLECALSRKFNMSCRNTCTNYRKFINGLS